MLVNLSSCIGGNRSVTHNERTPQSTNRISISGTASVVSNISKPYAAVIVWFTATGMLHSGGNIWFSDVTHQSRLLVLVVLCLVQWNNYPIFKNYMPSDLPNEQWKWNVSGNSTDIQSDILLCYLRHDDAFRIIHMEMMEMTDLLT